MISLNGKTIPELEAEMEVKLQALRDRNESLAQMFAAMYRKCEKLEEKVESLVQEKSDRA